MKTFKIKIKDAQVKNFEQLIENCTPLIEGWAEAYRRKHDCDIELNRIEVDRSSGAIVGYYD